MTERRSVCHAEAIGRPGMGRRIPAAEAPRVSKAPTEVVLDVSTWSTASHEEERGAISGRILAAALIILFIPYMQCKLCGALFKVEPLSFDTELWV